jgi:single-stranded-DNA-specific exonuclease
LSAAKTWQLLPHDPAAIDRLAGPLRLSPIIAQLLLNRGVHEPEAARRFLEAPLTDLALPAALTGTVEAAERLFQAVQQGKRICVYGDYDVDGITGTAILWQALRLINAQADFYVPHRLEEGYGLNAEALRQIAKSGAAVVITVDCGIAALAEADEARQLGLELIVTDHHEMKDRLPDAAVLVHPRLPGQEYAFGALSGAGVAFKVAWALCQRACGSEKVSPPHREFLMNAVVLAALGLIADVMPLSGENRVFVRFGLARLRRAPTLGLRALLEAAGLTDKKEFAADDVSFKLAPRLNAAGRLGCARLAVELLTTTSEDRATALARFLEKQNQDRQQLERRILTQAREQLEAEDLDRLPAIVLASTQWHAGVIGIVAGRLAERYGRPALMIALPADATADGVGQGSGRSITGFALHQALAHCAEHLVAHGGHAAAAGFKIRAAEVDAFRERFCACVTESFGGQPPAPRLVLDTEVPLGALTTGLVGDLNRLEPYGSGNRRPLFLAGGLQVVGGPTRIGNGERHMSFRVKQQGATLRAVAFGMADRLDELMSMDGHCCMAFTPRINEWNGFRKVELEVVDFQAGARACLT